MLELVRRNESFLFMAQQLAPLVLFRELFIGLLSDRSQDEIIMYLAYKLFLTFFDVRSGTIRCHCQHDLYREKKV
jgi:hypothetical protein